MTGSFGGAVGAAAANTEQEKRDKAEVDKLRKLLKEQKESHDQQVRELSSTLAQKNKEYLTVSSQTASQMEIAGKLMAEANKRLLDAGLSVRECFKVWAGVFAWSLELTLAFIKSRRPFPKSNLCPSGHQKIRSRL